MWKKVSEVLKNKGVLKRLGVASVLAIAGVTAARGGPGNSSGGGGGGAEAHVDARGALACLRDLLAVQQKEGEYHHLEHLVNRLVLLERPGGGLGRAYEAAVLSEDILGVVSSLRRWDMDESFHEAFQAALNDITEIVDNTQRNIELQVALETNSSSQIHPSSQS